MATRNIFDELMEGVTYMSKHRESITEPEACKMKIIVGFSTTNSSWSRLIRWFTDSQVSHTYIRIYDHYLHAPLIIHADWPGVIFEHAEQFDQDNLVIEEFEIEDERLEQGFKQSLKHLRKKYDFWDVINWALTLKFTRWFKRKIKNPLEDPKKLICVDLVARILNDSGITHLPVGDLHPKRLRAWFNAHYEEFGWKKLATQIQNE